jgi:hypothetical protein
MRCEYCNSELTDLNMAKYGVSCIFCAEFDPCDYEHLEVMKGVGRAFNMLLQKLNPPVDIDRLMP